MSDPSRWSAECPRCMGRGKHGMLGNEPCPSCCGSGRWYPPAVPPHVNGHDPVWEEAVRSRKDEFVGAMALELIDCRAKLDRLTTLLGCDRDQIEQTVKELLQNDYDADPEMAADE